MRSMFIPTLAFALLTFCSPDRDKTRETGMADTTTLAGGEAPAGDATPTPAAILSQLTAANTAEIQLARKATKQAASPQVREVAKKLAADHTRNLQQLRALAQKLNLDLTSAPAGAAPAADSTELPPDLQGKSGSEFDKAFVRHEIEAHQASIEKLRTQLIPAAQNEQIKAYLQKTVTDMQGHLAALERVQQQLGA
jgi:putative membrane protein